MKIFNDGDYIVLLSTCKGDCNVWEPRISIGYCYKLNKDAYSDNREFFIEKDNCGFGNGWSCNDPTYVSKLRMRLAFPHEIEKYKELGKPFKVNIKDERRYKLEKLRKNG